MENTKKPWVVLKFGGASLSEEIHYKYIIDILKKHTSNNNRICIVASAFSGISNMIESLYFPGKLDEHSQRKQQIIDIYTDIIDSLNLTNIVKNIFEEFIINLNDVNKNYNPIDAFFLGEKMSSYILYSYIQTNYDDAEYLDATDYINIPFEKCTNNFLKTDKNIVITQGFIAKDKNTNKNILLDRGGSDLSAILFAINLDATIVEFWKDVSGIFNADPKSIPNASIIESISFKSAERLLYNNYILHPSSIHYASIYGINMIIKCISNMHSPGTMISNECNTNEDDLVILSTIKDNIIIEVTHNIPLYRQDVYRKILSITEEYGFIINYHNNYKSKTTVSIYSLNIIDIEKRSSELLKSIKNSFNNLKTSKNSLLYLSGNFIDRYSFINLLKKHDLPLIDYLISDFRTSVWIKSDYLPACSKIIMDYVNKISTKSDFIEINNAKSWWKDLSSSLYKDKTPLYIYKLDVIKKKINALKSIQSIDSIFYSMKANNNKDVLDVIKNENIGFECSSIDEYRYIKNIYRNIHKDKIIFTPNFASIHEYEEVLSDGYNVTIDNIDFIKYYKTIFKNKKIILRFGANDLGGHHPHVMTKKSKFGIDGSRIEQIEELIKIINDLSIEVIGIHVHIGSGIYDYDLFRKNAEFINSISLNFPKVSFFNIGGGLGTIDYEKGKIFSPDKLENLLKSFKEDHPSAKLWIEPGRYLVEESGILLVSVTQIKKDGDKNYIGINTGFNSLIRPMLYGSYYNIVNLTKKNDKNLLKADIVGQLCESGDIFAKDRFFPKTDIGDVLLISNAGAYGRVMSSHYNMRKPADEEVLN